MTGKRPKSTLSLPASTGLLTDTPVKQTLASASISHSGFVDSEQPPHKRSRTSESAATNEAARQSTVLARLKPELNGAVFHDPKFLDTLPSRLMEEPTRGRSGEAALPPDGDGAQCDWSGRPFDYPRAASPYVPFSNKSDRVLNSSYDGMSTAPDIIKCKSNSTEDSDVHWHDVHLYVEVKKSRKLANQAIQRSACYARALLAHRVDRWFVKTLVVCGTTSVFLHYDRSGLVYSDDIDIYASPRQFTRALTGLLLLGRIDAGYNPIFRNVWVRGSDKPSLMQLQVFLNDTMYLVVEILCNCKSIQDRATLVLALRKALETLDPDGTSSATGDNPVIDAVLKLLWRDPTRFQERLILDQFIGVYGICQVLSDADATIGGEPDVVYPRAGLLPGPRGHVFGRLGQNIDITGAQRDDARVLSMLLMQPGRPLSQAKDASELKAAFVGAIMGQWALCEKLGLDAEAYGRAFDAPNWETIFNDPAAPRYKRAAKLKWFNPARRFAFLKRVVTVLGPGPFGFLSDVDLANIVRGGASDMHTHRTGTLSFMALTLLAEDSEVVEHSYLHDLESFFWVLLYVVAEHREGETPNRQAQRVLSGLNIISRHDLYDAKYTLLGRIGDGEIDISSFETSWAADLAPVLRLFARWVKRVSRLDFDSTADPDTCFEEVLNLFLPPYNPASLSSKSEIRPDSLTTE
ncbi:hypothetical protein FRC10_004383 [Ceratobasidium sp. 414]|nr:hypothetical protein FRC10_004383 [Ceratobasidium sp. 414]